MCRRDGFSSGISLPIFLPPLSTINPWFSVWVALWVAIAPCFPVTYFHTWQFLCFLGAAHGELPSSGTFRRENMRKINDRYEERINGERRSFYENYATRESDLAPSPLDSRCQRQPSKMIHGLVHGLHSTLELRVEVAYFQYELTPSYGLVLFTLYHGWVVIRAASRHRARTTLIFHSNHR